MPAEGEKQPGLVQWITKLQTTGSLDQKRMIRFQITGVAYGDKDFMATDTFSDDLTFHVQLLSEMGKTWLQKITNEIDLCEKLSETVGYLAKDLEIARGQFGEKRQQEIVKEAKEAFYFRMDQPFDGGCMPLTRRGKKRIWRSVYGIGVTERRRRPVCWDVSWYRKPVRRPLRDVWLLLI